MPSTIIILYKQSLGCNLNIDLYSSIFIYSKKNEFLNVSISISDTRLNNFKKSSLFKLFSCIFFIEYFFIRYYKDFLIDIIL